MGYFPFFVDLEGREGLVAGGGTVALRKIEKLVPYGPRLTVAALSFRKEIERIEGLFLLRESFSERLLEGKDFVVAATDDRNVNHRISRLCQERHILVNVADDKEACTFLFPSLVKKGRLSVGISTEGASPSGAIYIRKHLEQWISEDFDRILDFLEQKRAVVRKMIPQEERRAAVLARLFRQCMDAGQGLAEEEFWNVMKQETGGKESL